MKSYFSYFVLGIFIISNKLFLFNEEFLILICFSSFCSVIHFKLKSSIQFWFENKINSNESLLVSSINNTEGYLKGKHSLNSKLLDCKKLFTLLKTYYNKFLNNYLKTYSAYLGNTYKLKVLNKLELLKRVEGGYSKLVLLLITNKINSISILINFYRDVLPINRFRLIDRINKQNLFNKI